MATNPDTLEKTKTGGKLHGSFSPVINPDKDSKFPYNDCLNTEIRMQAIARLDDIEGKKRVGRPSEYDPVIACMICEMVAAGYTITQITKRDDMPGYSAIHAWLALSEEFSKSYTRASQIKLLGMADEIIDIADDGSNDWMERECRDGRIEQSINPEAVNRSRLRVDSRKWLLAKLMPSIFGEKITMDVTADYSAMLAEARKRVKARAVEEKLKYAADPNDTPDAELIAQTDNDTTMVVSVQSGAHDDADNDKAADAND